VIRKKHIQHSGEVRARRQIEPVLEIFGDTYCVYPEVGLAAVFDPESLERGSPEWSQVLNGRFDYLVCKGDEGEPKFAVELDGIDHKRLPQKIKNDRLKNNICKMGELPLLRIQHQHVIEKPRDLAHFIFGASAPATFLQYAIWFLAVYVAFEDFIADLADTPDECRGRESLSRVRDRLLGDIGNCSEHVEEPNSTLSRRGVYWGPHMEELDCAGVACPDFRFRRGENRIVCEAMHNGSTYTCSTAKIEVHGVPDYLSDCIALSYQVRNVFAQIGLDELRATGSLLEADRMWFHALRKNDRAKSAVDSGIISVKFHRSSQSRADGINSIASRIPATIPLLPPGGVMVARGSNNLLHLDDSDVRRLITKYSWQGMPADP